MKSDNDISESAVMDVQRNFNEGSSYEKQLMSILYFAPFTVEFDRRLDIFYSLLDEGLISVIFWGRLGDQLLHSPL